MSWSIPRSDLRPAHLHGRRPRDLAASECGSIHYLLQAPWRFADDGNAGRKIRISGRLWMNSLDALAAAAKEGAGIVRVPSWQAEADLAAGTWCGARRAPAPLAPDVSAVAAGFAEDQGFVDYLVERWRGIDPFGAQPRAANKRIIDSIL